jgi:outer membrane protein OmpA-like peptidoglycan-associated protein
MKKNPILFGFLSLMALTEIAFADDINFGKTTPSTNQVIEALSPDINEATENPKAKSRSIDMSNLGALPKSNKAHKTNAPAALSMEILFDYKLAELTDVAKNQLKPVGEALASEKLQNLNFVVEGHTDAIGGYAYNKTLSEERADSVKRFLVDSFHIEPSRIHIIGKGKNDLLDPTNPASEVNRRVRIVATK